MYGSRPRINSLEGVLDDKSIKTKPLAPEHISDNAPKPNPGGNNKLKRRSLPHAMFASITNYARISAEVDSEGVFNKVRKDDKTLFADGTESPPTSHKLAIKRRRALSSGLSQRRKEALKQPDDAAPQDPFEDNPSSEELFERGASLS